jgi:hypothetical protein
MRFLEQQFIMQVTLAIATGVPNITVDIRQVVDRLKAAVVEELTANGGLEDEEAALRIVTRVKKMVLKRVPLR